MATTTGEATGTTITEVPVEMHRIHAEVSTVRRLSILRTTPGAATEAISMVAVGENRTRHGPHIGLCTGSIDTMTRDKTGTMTNEVASSTTMTSVREVAASMISEEPGKIGKEIKRIMTSQISARGKELEALED